MPFWQPPPSPPPPPPVLDIGVLDLSWLGGLVAVHATIYLLLRFLLGARRLPNAQSTVAAVVTYNITATCFACFTTVLGFRAWYGGEVDAIGATAQGRLFGRSETFQVLATATAVYEVYNTALTAVMPEYRTLDFVGHHFTTFLLALFGSYPFLNYYGVFFFGVASVSSIPLCAAELAKYLGSKELVSVFQAIFALLFIGFRTIYWPCVSFHFWADSVAALRGEAGTNAPAVHSGAAFALFLVANLGLTGLQLLWTSKILKAVAHGDEAKTTTKA